MTHHLGGCIPAYCALLTLGFSTTVVLAAPINYGDFAGTHVTYIGVTESSSPGDPSPLFGPPGVFGDSIDFNPVGFDASSSGASSDITDSNLSFVVAAKVGSRIDRMILTEAGDTTLAGNVAPGSMATASAVFASGVLDILQVDFVNINHISVPFSMTFSPSGGTYFLGTDGGGGPLFNTQWSGSVTLDIEAILLANSIDFDHGATRISINMDNTLTAVSQAGTAANIAKKDFGAGLVLIAVENDVPEPASVVLLLIGSMVLRRRGWSDASRIG